MGTKLREVLCDKNGISGSGEYCGNNDAHLDHISVFYHEALGGKHAPCSALFDLEPGVIGAVALSRRSASSLARATP
jgi:tubulin beta